MGVRTTCYNKLMENRIREYEEFIKKASKSPTKELAKYHAEMLKNFQHERLVHLIITLFFAALTILSLALAAFLTVQIQDFRPLIPIYLLSFLLLILEIFYIRHYYFLENHIQALYDYTKKLYRLEDC